MIRGAIGLFLTSICFGTHAGLVDFNESSDLKSFNPPVFVLDSAGVNRWIGIRDE